MAVYTTLERDEISALVTQYGLGPLIDYQGSAEGIENTTYFITTDESDRNSEEYTQPERYFVLTLFETLSTEQLPFYVELLTLLHTKGLPVPCPLRDADGKAIQCLQGKPVLLIPKMPGNHPKTATAEQCRAIGKALAQLHLVGLESGIEYQAQRDIDWLRETTGTLLTNLEPDEQILAQDELQNLGDITSGSELPKAIIHGDLFRDNTLFESDQLSALIDFYNAGTGYLMTDLAIVVNDWCSEADGSLDNDRVNSMVAAYCELRSPDTNEAKLWNHFLRLAAFRFWISRLLAHQTHRPGGLTEQKDPDQYKQILLDRRNNPQTFPR